MENKNNKEQTTVPPSPQQGPKRQVHKVTVPIPAGAHLEILQFEYYVSINDVTLMIFSWHNRFYIINIADIADQTNENTARPVAELCDNRDVIVQSEQSLNLRKDPADSSTSNEFDL